MNAIALEHAGRVYQTTTGFVRRHKKEISAVVDLSFEVAQGELFGMLGPNGAGKTTTIKMLTTLLRPTSGKVSVAGFDVARDAARIRPLIGFAFGGERGLYYRLNGRDNLRYFAELYRLPPRQINARVEELLELVRLHERADERVEGYSRGMKQRLHLARTLLHDPNILFLDEPTIGLDPVGARELRETIRQLHERGKTILLTTHYMFEADALCDRIVVIGKGRLLASGTPRELKSLVRDLSVVELEVFGATPEVIDRVRALDFVDSVVVEQRDLRQVLRVQTPIAEQAVPRLLGSLDGLEVGRVSVREATLEDAYVRLVERTE
jgi:ABC-2 type transport system ATP-binding protein